MENLTTDSNDRVFYTDKLDIVSLKIKEVEEDLASLKEELTEKEKEFKLSLLCLFILNIINLMFCIFR